ncbi:MAG: CHASE2 domain-containing protein, partial [Bacteroidota bacterium]
MVVLAGLFVSLLLLAPESWWRDQRIAARDGTPLSDELMLVGLDAAYAERFGGAAAVPKAYLAQLVDALLPHEPSVIAFDVLVGPYEPDSVGLDAFRRAVERAIAQGVEVVLPARTGGFGADRTRGRWLRTLAVPPAPLDTLTRSGYVDYPVTYEGGQTALQNLLAYNPTVRAFPLAVRLDPATPLERHSVAASFPVVAVASHRGWLPEGAASPLAFSDDEVQSVLDSLQLATNSVVLGEQLAPLH